MAINGACAVTEGSCESIEQNDVVTARLVRSGQESRGIINVANDVRCKECREDITHRSANHMDGEAVEGIIDLQSIFELSCEIACNTSSNANWESCPHRDEAGTRADCDEASQKTVA